MKNKLPETSVRLSTLLDRLGLSQADLARLSGLDSSNISYYVSGKKEPGPLASLMIAGLADTAQERAFWTANADLSESQRSLVAKACGTETERKGSREYLVRKFLEFWENPRSKTLEGVRIILADALFADEQEK